MNKNGFWYGYLEAGDKSTAVLRDPGLDTGNKKTVYLFNLARRQILEYTLAIVESKLRPLEPRERDMVGDIDTAYAEARKGFGTARRSAAVQDAAPAPRKSKNNAEADDTDDDVDYDDMEDIEEEPGFAAADEDDEVA